MRNRWIIAGSVFAELAACLVAIALAGGGHGTYHAAKCLFPYTMISTGFLHAITLPFIVLACVQFPAYGVILSVANKRGKLGPVALGVVTVHLAMTALAFVFSYSGFYP